MFLYKNCTKITPRSNRKFYTRKNHVTKGSSSIRDEGFFKMATKILFLTLNIFQIKEAGEKEMIRYGTRYTRILIKNIEIVSTTNYGMKIFLHYI